MLTDGLVQDGIYEFVYIVTPQYALGATAGSTPPAALGQPRRHHDRHDGGDGGKG